MFEARNPGATRPSRSPRPTSGRPAARFLAAGLLAASTVAVARPAHDTVASAQEPVWVLVDTETNPENDTEREGWSVSVSSGSLTIDVLVFPSDPDSTARVTGSAPWDPFPDTLTPGQRLSLPITVSSAAAAGVTDGFYSKFSVIAMVDGGWNQDAVGAGTSCSEGTGQLVCTPPESVSDTLDYSVPGYGEVLRLGVGALNCGGVCTVDFVYELREPGAATTAPPPMTEPTDATMPTTDTGDLPDRRTALTLVTADELERFDALMVVWSVLADGALGGRTSTQSLELVRDLVDDYFAELILQATEDGDERLAESLRDVRAHELSRLDGLIDEARDRDAEDALGLRSALLQQVLFGGAESVVPGEAPDRRIDDLLDALRDLDDGRSAFDGQLMGTAPSGDPNEFRTVRFTNLGSDAVTVRPYTYVPALDVVAPMSRASTVVFPDPNPSAALALPRGTYTFCYDWDLGTDKDGDGYADERYSLTGEVNVGTETSSDFDRAPVVTVDPSGGTPGSCPGSPGPGGGVTPSGFTPQEDAADGLYDYDVVCSSPDGSIEELQRSYRFVIGDAVTEWWDEDEGGLVELFWVDTNRYETADGAFEFVFTGDGFELIPRQPDLGTACTGTRRS